MNELTMDITNQIFICGEYIKVIEFLYTQVIS